VKGEIERGTGDVELFPLLGLIDEASEGSTRARKHENSNLELPGARFKGSHIDKAIVSCRILPDLTTRGDLEIQ
jgi:hypothetical protein